MRFLRGFLALMIGLVLGQAHAQIGHQLRAVSFAFLPDTVVMTAGDTVLFRPLGGHDMTQVDSAFWAEGLAEWNGGFATTNGMDTDLVFTAPGTYYFVCSPHSAVMRGVLIVSDASVAVQPQLSGSAPAITYDARNGALWLRGSPQGERVLVTVWDAAGRLVHSGEGAGGSHWSLPSALSAGGHYTVSARGSGKPATITVVPVH